MTPSNIRPIGIFLIAAVGAFVLWKTISQHKGAKIEPPRKIPVMTAVLLKEEAAEEGKVVEFVANGMPTIKYTCLRNDADVAWVAINDASGKAIPTATYINVTDKAGHHYPISTTQTGPIFRVCVQRGYARKPDSVILNIQSNDPNQALYNSHLTLSKFAEPVRFIEAPSASQIASNEKLAQVFLAKDGMPEIRSLEAHAADERIESYVVRSSFGADSLAMPYYAEQADFLQVKLIRVKRFEARQTLVYHDAQIVRVNSVGTLRLPTTQTLGSVFGLAAIVTKMLPVPSPLKKNHGTHGEFTVHLVPPPVRSSNAPGKIIRMSTVEFLSLSPNVDQIGLDYIEVRLSGADSVSGFDTSLKPKSKGAAPPSATIPELKLSIKTTWFVETSSKTVVLPVHHAN